MLEIDGSKLEGGGQILRTSLALSAVTGRACRIFNIRKGRDKPGLATQHLLALRALTKLSGAKIEGDFLGSTEIKFIPGSLEWGEKTIDINIETAGSITLILQALIIPSLFSKEAVFLNFQGGATDTFFSPTIDYFQHVFLKLLEKLGAVIEIKIKKRGYYPEGGAEIEVVLHPLSQKKDFDLTERGKLEKITVFSGAAETLKARKVAERQLAGVREILGKLKLPLEEKISYYPAKCPGSSICLVAKFENTVIGTDNLGKLGKRAEDVGKEAALALLQEQKTGACIDRYGADQILPYLALLTEKSKVTVTEVTRHCQTNIWVIEKFLIGKFKVENQTIAWLQNETTHQH